MSNDPEHQTLIERHEQYARFDPDNAMLQSRLGELYHAAGRFEDAAAAFERCLRAEPRDTVTAGRLAGVLLDLHRFERAEALLKGLIDQGEPHPVLRYNLGLAVYHQRRWDEAAAWFAQALEEGFAEPSGFAYLARSLHHEGLMEEAIEAARRWHELAPGRETLSYLALLLADDGQTEESAGLARQALAEDPQDVDANVVMGLWLVEQQETQAATQHCERALRHEPDNGRAWLGLGLARLHGQDHEAAIAALERAVRSHPDNPGINVTLGWARLVAQDAVGAEAVFRQAIAVDPTFSESHGGLAAALVQLGRLDEAQPAITRAKRLDVTSIGADIARTWLLAAQGGQEAATDVFSTMLERAPLPGGRPLRETLQRYAMHGTDKKGTST